MLPKSRVTLVSSVQVDELERRLRNITQALPVSTSPTFAFEGDVGNGEFVLVPSFSYTPRNQMRPQLRGRLSKVVEGCRIDLVFEIPPGQQVFIWFVLALNSFAIVAMLSGAILTDLIVFHYWWVVALAVPLTASNYLANYHFKAKRSLSILTTTMEAKAVSPPY